LKNVRGEDERRHGMRNEQMKKVQRLAIEKLEAGVTPSILWGPDYKPL
jgi:hypothetical protein